jgi:integrase
MRVFKTTYRDRQGVTQESSKWYVEFRDHAETIRRLPAFTSKQASEAFGQNLDKLISYHRATGGLTDPSLQQWLSQIPQSARERLVEIGLLDGERAAVTKPLSKHLDDFAESLKAKGSTSRHVELVKSRASKVIEGCGFQHYSSISASKVLSQINDLRQAKNGISAQTFNFYLQAIKQFCRWMVKDRRATENPLLHLQGLNVRTDRRHDRRALSLEELTLLLETATDGPVRFNVSGQERALLYRLAVETGLRAGELRSLSPASFRLSGDEPTVTVAAAYCKNRRESTLPLRPDTVEMLVVHLKDQQRDVCAFAVPPREHVAKMIRADLDAARAKWIKEAKNGEEGEHREKSDFLTYTNHAKRKADFHALRHTFISNLAAGGVHPKIAQTLARHSTFALTMERYSHSDHDKELAAMRTLPNLPKPAPKASKTSEKPGKSASSVLAFCLAQNGTSGEISVDSGGLKSDTGDDSQNAPRKGNTAFSNGGDEIRTHETLSGLPVFKTGAFNRSATPPESGRKCSWGGKIRQKGWGNG